eukprot:3514868-Prymnesium_polylepis.1
MQSLGRINYKPRANTSHFPSALSAFVTMPGSRDMRTRGVSERHSMSSTSCRSSTAVCKSNSCMIRPGVFGLQSRESSTEAGCGREAAVFDTKYSAAVRDAGARAGVSPSEADSAGTPPQSRQLPSVLLLLLQR